MYMFELFDPRSTVRAACCRRAAATGASRNFAVLDTVRALSVLWLVCFHSYYEGGGLARSSETREALRVLPASNLNWSGVLVQGHYAVDGFLVISGFLITRVIVREQHRRGAVLRLRRFFMRRLLRVGPALVAMMCIVGWTDSACAHPANVARTLLYVNNLWPMKNMCIPWTWSLSLEVQFYVAIATILVVLRGRLRAQKIACLVGVLGTFAYRVCVARLHDYEWPLNAADFNAQEYNTDWTDLLYTSIPGRFGNIFVGSYTALQYWGVYERGGGGRGGDCGDCGEARCGGRQLRCGGRQHPSLRPPHCAGRTSRAVQHHPPHHDVC